MRSNLIFMVISAASLAFGCPTRRPSHSTTKVSTPSTVSAAPQVTPTSSTIVNDAAPTTTLATSVTSASTSASVPSNSVTPIGNSGAVSGRSTFYGGNLSGGTCSFSTYALPAGMFGTAFSGSAWNNAANCGACVRVTGPNGNTITAMIVDQCPECEEGHLDLFQNAFEQLGDLSAGIIETSYTFVDCGIASPITLHNKEGTSQYWFAMQVVNANEPVASLEVSTDGGNTWQQTTRASYNFFQNQSGFGTDTVDVRVTSSTGKSIIVNDVGVASGSQTTCGSNF